MELKPHQIDKNIIRKRDMISNSINYINGYPLFSILELNIWGACNRSCSFCPVSNPNVYTNKNEGISIDLYKKIIIELAEIDYESTILFSAFSEPFLNKNLKKLIEMTKYYLPKVHLEVNTNGDVIKRNEKKLLSLYDSGLDTVVISVYDGIEEFKFFEQIQTKYKISHEKYQIRRRYFDKKSGDYGIIFSNRSGTIDIKNYVGQDDALDNSLPLQKNCFYPFYQTMIDYNGDMLLCPHDWGKEFIIGNLNKSNIVSLWTSKKNKFAREKLSKKNRSFKPCQTCNVRGDVIGKEMFDAWQRKKN